MKKIKTNINGLFIIENKAFKDTVYRALGNRQYYSTAAIAASLKFALSAIRSLSSVGCVLFYNK